MELCKETLLPLGIDFKACDNPANIPFQDESFDLINKLYFVRTGGSKEENEAVKEDTKQ